MEWKGQAWANDKHLCNVKKTDQRPFYPPRPSTDNFTPLLPYYCLLITTDKAALAGNVSSKVQVVIL